MDGSLGNNLGMLLLILLALAAAWYLGRLSQSRPRSRQSPGRDYFIGLNYLLNDEPDEAIDTFIHALEADSNALETHLALGTLLRRRGKVDKSIVVYQGLLDRPELGEDEKQRVKLELARSHIAAGLLDRAESLLEELQGARPELWRAALVQAVNLYQLEKDWSKGVRAAEELLRVCPVRERGRHQSVASHFHCELAEQAMSQANFPDARDYLKKALQLHRANVRASLLLARVELLQGNPGEAAKILARVQQQDPDYQSETIVPLMESYRQLGADRPLRKFIQGNLEGQPSASVVLEISRHIDKEAGRAQALDFLRERLRQKHSMKIMNRLLVLLSEEKGGPLQQDLQTFHQILQDYLKSRPGYQCVNCGYEARSLHWLCPGCSEWGMIKPVKGVTGE